MNRLGLADGTIAAVATARGRSALAVIRISGALAHTIGRRLCEHWPETPRVVTRTPIRGSAGASLDDAMVVRYDAPASFTGEDLLEITSHGGNVVPTTILAAAIELGARAAEPGEFTRRAILNGKLDVLQAEAVADLIDATSRRAQQIALGQLDGGLTRRIEQLRATLISAEAMLSYDIDFPEEDGGPIPRERITAAIDSAAVSLDELLTTTRAGELVREGALTVLAGAPNAGKSSLFNALLGQRRAIVTDVPGTTRDAIEAVVDVGRWPLRLVDTAGLRATTDPVERLGVEVSTDYLGRADVVLVCGESVDALKTAMAGVPGTADRLLVATKSDLDGVSSADLERLLLETAAVGAVAVSATLRTGLDTLVSEIMRALDRRAGAISDDAPVLTRARHRFIIGRARDELGLFREAWIGDALPATVAAVHLHAAVASLEELIGSVDVEQVLDELFSRFCVGK